MRVVIVKFPAGKTKQTVRLQHVASGKIFVRLLYCSLRVLGREPSVGGAPLSEYGLRRLICLLKRFHELVLCQHLISPAPSVVLLQTRSKRCCKLTVPILLPTRKVPDGRCDWDMACTSRATAPRRSRPRQSSILIPGTVNALLTARCRLTLGSASGLPSRLLAPPYVGLGWMA